MLLCNVCVVQIVSLDMPVNAPVPGGFEARRCPISLRTGRVARMAAFVSGSGGEKNCEIEAAYSISICGGTGMARLKALRHKSLCEAPGENRVDAYTGALTLAPPQVIRKSSAPLSHPLHRDSSAKLKQ